MISAIEPPTEDANEILIDIVGMIRMILRLHRAARTGGPVVIFPPIPANPEAPKDIVAGAIFKRNEGIAAIPKRADIFDEQVM